MTWTNGVLQRICRFQEHLNFLIKLKYGSIFDGVPFTHTFCYTWFEFELSMYISSSENIRETFKCFSYTQAIAICYDLLVFLSTVNIFKKKRMRLTKMLPGNCYKYLLAWVIVIIIVKCWTKIIWLTYLTRQH